MLILGRKEGENVVIDGKCIIKVVKIQGNRITLGIEAPNDVKVLRGELLASEKQVPTFELIVEDGLLVPC